MIWDWRPSLALDVVKYCMLNRILIWRVALLNSVLNVGVEGELNFVCACPTVICLTYPDISFTPITSIAFFNRLALCSKRDRERSHSKHYYTSSHIFCWSVFEWLLLFTRCQMRCALSWAGHGWAVAWMNKMFKGGRCMCGVIDGGERSGREVWLN